MNTKWLLAKYVRDLRRREPVNVGVIVFAHGEIAARFVGETDGKAIDGRRTRGFADPENYRAWVAHWRRSIDERWSISGFMTIRSPASFFLEFGGERLLGNGDVAIEPFTERLFADLVARRR